MTEIFCFSNCDVVELFFDGKKIPGIPEYLQPGSTFPYLNWTLPYKSGTVTAVGKINGVEVCRQYLTSPGAVAGLKLTADREKLSADGEDLAFIRVDVVDKDGNFVPDAGDLRAALFGDSFHSLYLLGAELVTYGFCGYFRVRQTTLSSVISLCRQSSIPTTPY